MAKIKAPSPASLCAVFIQKVVRTPAKDHIAGFGTGFLYRGPDGRSWLVTSWHVLTGRRPEDPGILLPNYPQSPYRILVTHASTQRGAFTEPLVVDLYEDGKPIWFEYCRGDGIDLAAIPIKLPSFVAGVMVQDFAEIDKEVLEPGIDLIIVGYPFQQSIDYPFPIWKRAMLATEPRYLVLGTAQMLVDSPGSPGMSGSAVYRSAMGVSVTAEQAAAMKEYERTKTGALDLVKTFSEQQMLDRGLMLEFVGVYAGATAKPHLEHLNLGRIFMASFVSLLISQGQRGENPFPPL